MLLTMTLDLRLEASRMLCRLQVVVTVISAVKTTPMTGIRMLERGPIEYMSGGGL